MKIINKIHEECIRTIELSNGHILRVCYWEMDIVTKWGRDIEVIVDKVDDLFWPFRVINTDNREAIKARYYYDSNLIPDSKFDSDAVKRIESANVLEIEPILPDLFEWTEDLNWPIAAELGEVLSKFGEIIIPYIKYYLMNPLRLDEYTTYYHIMPKMTLDQLKLVKDELTLVAEKPNDFQIEEGYDEFAKEYLDKIKDL